MILQYYRKLQENAVGEVKAVDRPPYLSGGEDEASQADVQRTRMAAGVRYQPGVRRRESCSTLRSNSSSAMTTGRSSHWTHPRPAPIALLVNPSGLLDALVKVFDALWRAAVPLSPRGSAMPLDDHDRAVLTLIAAGATDEVIARRLAISRRSVVRRTGMLMERLGATTRFQAGVQAARRGWL